MAVEPTAAEAKWIRGMKALAKRRPKRLWLFSANGTLCVMRSDEDGGHIHLMSNDGIDPAFILDTLKIPNDGGDW